MVAYGIGAWIGGILATALSGDSGWAMIGIAAMVFALIMRDFAKEVKKK